MNERKLTKITDKKFYNIKFKFYLIAYAVILVVSYILSVWGESDGDAVLFVFALMFGIYFCVYLGIAAALSVIAAILIKVLKSRKGILSCVIFTLVSVAYLAAVVMTVSGIHNLSFSLGF